MASRAGIVAVLALLTVSRAAAAYDIGGSVADLVGDLMPSVVNISSTLAEMLPASNPTSAGARRSKTLGSGFVIDASGIIVTNKHVIEGAREVSVTLEDNLTYPATILSQAEQADLALLKIEVGHPLPALHFGDSDKVRVGDTVLAIGNPLGVGESVSAGIVSALNRDIRDTPFDDYIQTDAAINHGNSGGPLFNLAGDVIGINTALYSNVPAGGSIGLGFSIPSNDARFVVEQLRRFGRVRPGWLAIHTQPITPEIADALGMSRPEGALVASVDANGPAEPTTSTAIEVGDAITTFNGIRIRDIRQLAREAARAPLGEVARLGIWRNGAAQAIAVTVNEMPSTVPVTPPGSAAAAAALVPAYDLGLRLAPATPEARALYHLGDDQIGCVVLDVAPTGAAAETGLAEGDLIVRVQQNKLTTPNELLHEIDLLRAQSRRYALLLVVNKDGAKWVPLPLQ